MKESREVTLDEAELYGNNLKMKYYDTSAKEDLNVKDAFNNLA